MWASLKGPNSRSTWSTSQRSAWRHTAVEAQRYPRVDQDVRTDVLVIGGGYAGLNAALRLREIGYDVAVIEAASIGFGASGRNGGQVIPGLKWDPPELVSRFGLELGNALIEFAGGAPQYTFDIIESYQLNCEAIRSGWLQPAVDLMTMTRARARALSWADRGVAVEIYNEEQTRWATGSGFYVGAWVDPRGGSLQPLSYARELARVAAREGAAIFELSPATSFCKTASGWTASVNGRNVTAERVLVCTNGYSDNLVEGFRRSIVPASSIICATAPLSAELRKSVMPSGLPLSDARRLLVYARFDSQGRFLIGARGSFGLHEPERKFKKLRRTALQIFPQLKHIEWEDAWGGKFALTPDHLPHLHNPECGLYIAAGCNGRGVAILSRLGRLLADLATGIISPAESPISVTAIKTIPFYALRRPALEASALWYRFSDMLGR